MLCIKYIVWMDGLVCMVCINVHGLLILMVYNDCIDCINIWCIDIWCINIWCVLMLLIYMVYNDCIGCINIDGVYYYRWYVLIDIWCIECIDCINMYGLY